MKTFLSIAIILIASSLAYSQDGSTFEFSPGWDIYANNYLNGPATGRGNTGVSSCTEGISGVFLNPASFNVDKKFEFSYQFNYKTNSSYIYKNYKDPNDKFMQQFPSMATAAGYKLNRFLEFGLFYNNPTAMHNEEGSGYNRIHTIQTVGIPVRFSYYGLHFGLSLEVSYYYTSLSEFYDNINHRYHASDIEFNVRIGLAYESPDKEVSFGLSIIPQTTLKPVSNLRGPVGLEYYGWPVYPAVINLGFGYQFSKFPLKILVESRIQGSSISTKSAIDLKTGFEYRLNKKIVLRCGGFTNHNETPFDGQAYITAGCGVNLANFNIDAAILDSHISKGPTNTIFQTSVAYGF